MVRLIAADSKHSLLAVSLFDRKVVILDMHDYQEKCWLADEFILPISMTFHPDGKRFATCDFGGTVRLWDTTDGRELLRCECSEARAVAFSPDGKRLMIGDFAGGFDVWESGFVRPEMRLPVSGKSIGRAVFSDDQTEVYGSHLLNHSYHSDNPHLWDLATHSRRTRIRTISLRAGSAADGWETILRLRPRNPRTGDRSRTIGTARQQNARTNRKLGATRCGETHTTTKTSTDGSDSAH